MKELKIGEYVVRIGNSMPDLVEKRYNESGLMVKSHTPTSFFVECLKFSEVVGSATLDMGPAQNFFANLSYPEKLKSLQENGAKLLEITKLVIERGQETKWVIGCMFNLMYRVCVIRHGVTHIVMECKPNHVAGYRRLLKFEVVDGPTWNPIAQGEVYLLALDIQKASNF